MAQGVTADKLDAELRKIETQERSGWFDRLPALALGKIYFDEEKFHADEPTGNLDSKNVRKE